MSQPETRHGVTIKEEEVLIYFHLFHLDWTHSDGGMNENTKKKKIPSGKVFLTFNLWQ